MLFRNHYTSYHILPDALDVGVDSRDKHRPKDDRCQAGDYRGQDGSYSASSLPHLCPCLLRLHYRGTG